MKRNHPENLFKLFFRRSASSRIPRFVVALPQSRSKRVLLVVLIAFIPISLALLPFSAGLVAMGVIITLAIMICMSLRVSLLEWVIVIATGLVLIAMAFPSVHADHTRRNEMERRRQANLAKTPTTVPPGTISDQP